MTDHLDEIRSKTKYGCDGCYYALKVIAKMESDLLRMRAQLQDDYFVIGRMARAFPASEHLASHVEKIRSVLDEVSCDDATTTG